MKKTKKSKNTEDPQLSQSKRPQKKLEASTSDCKTSFVISENKLKLKCQTKTQMMEGRNIGIKIFKEFTLFGNRLERE